MDSLDIALHLMNFSAPALVLALVLPIGARHVLRLPTGPLAIWQQMTGILLVGVAVLVLGVIVLGRDGKMSTYGLMVLLQATCQWLLSRAWRH